MGLFFWGEGIRRRQCHYAFNTVFWKPCMVFCTKLKELDSIKLKFFLWQKSVLITLKYIINNGVLKHRSYEYSSFVLENIYNRNSIPLAHSYIQPLSPSRVHTKISSCLSFFFFFFVLWCSSRLIRHILLFVYIYFFVKSSIPYMAPLTSATPALSTLWLNSLPFRSSFRVDQLAMLWKKGRKGGDNI